MGEAIGLLGGSFNPIHYGHLAMAAGAKAELGLSRVILMPDGDPPHKAQSELASPRDRLHMTALAAEGRFEVSAMEVERPGKTYTVDTIDALGRAYPSAAFFVLIGGDTLGEIAGWRESSRLFTLCRFAVIGRAGYPPLRVPGADVVALRAEAPPISATAIRERVRLGLSLEGLTPRPVADYIGARRLYGPPPLLPEKEILTRLKGELPPARYLHTLGVAEAIARLAERFGQDPDRARLAGLLHDCAKSLTLEEMLARVEADGGAVDEARKASRALLHAPAGAALARAEYGVTDPGILHAIQFHNTGCVPLCPLDMLLCVADMIEPTRKPFAGLGVLRDLAERDLHEAYRETLRQKLIYIRERGGEAHPDTANALAVLESDRKREGTQ